MGILQALRRVRTRLLSAKARDITEDQPYDLVFLTKRKCIRVRATGYSISRVSATVENLLDRRLQVVVNPGTYFVSTGAHQNMATTREYDFTLYPSSTRSFDVDAVCIDADRPVPGDKDFFRSVSRVPDDVAKFIQASRGCDPLAIQAGVWSLTDNYTGEQVQSHLVSRDRFGNTRRIVTDIHIAEASIILNRLRIPHRLCTDMGIAVTTSLSRTDLKERDVEAGISALEALGRDGHATLVRLLDHESPNVRSRVAKALGNAHQKEMMPILINSFSKANLAQIEIDAKTTALEQFLPDSAQAFRQFAAHKDPRVRVRTLRVLPEIGSVEQVIQLLRQDSVPAVRIEAARCLSEVKTEESRTALAQSLGDENESVREVSLQALSARGQMLADGMRRYHIATARDHSSSYERRVSAIRYCAGQGHGEILLDALADSNSLVRTEAAKGLRQLRRSDRELTNRLREKLTDKNWRVREAAKLALGPDALNGSTK